MHLELDASFTDRGGGGYRTIGFTVHLLFADDLRLVDAERGKIKGPHTYQGMGLLHYTHHRDY